MKSIVITLLLSISFFQYSFGQSPPNDNNSTNKPPDRVIFAYGGQLDKTFLLYILKLTGKENPRIGFLPTASGDDPKYISFWNNLSKGLVFRPLVIKVSSYSPSQLLEMDAIVVGAGNAITMLALWKLHGIDTILRKAYEKGIIMAGGSAGSLCWFANGITASGSPELTEITGLGFLQFSHCPHYHSQAMRKPKFEESILKARVLPGYACDDLSGIVFRNGIFQKSVSQNNKNNNYYVSGSAGIINEQLLKSEMIK